MIFIMSHLFPLLICLLLMTPPAAAENNNFETAVREAVTRQMKIYPKSTLKDIYKNFFQDRFGPGHIINDTVAASRYLRHELNSYSTISGETAEPTGWQHNFYRVNLSVVKNKIIPYEDFLDAFVRSVNGIKPVSIKVWRKEWSQIEKIIRLMELSLPTYDEDREYIETQLEAGNYVGHHSKSFNEAYAPHYRIVSKKIFEEELLPLLSKTDY